MIPVCHGLFEILAFYIRLYQPGDAAFVESIWNRKLLLYRSLGGLIG